MMLENIMIIAFVVILMIGGGLAWWFENGKSNHTHDANPTDNSTKTEQEREKL